MLATSDVRWLVENPVRMTETDSLNLDAPGVPERRVMSAVLWNAFHALERTASAREAMGRQEHAELLHWFESDEVVYVFSFRNICSHLRIDVDRVRARVAQLTPLTSV